MPDNRPELRAPARWEQVLGRVLDLVLATVLVVLTAPLLIAIAIAVRLDSPGAALFRQRRLGRNRSGFTMLKFRTMRVGGDDSAHRELIAREIAGEDTSTGGSWKIDDDPRVTRVGHVLRRFSLDELPQLFNVIAGSMSLVGPRPCLDWEAELFPPEYEHRFAVRPGLTGLWQVSGRSRLSTLDMLRLDAQYVQAWSLLENLRILVRTIPVLLRTDGAR